MWQEPVLLILPIETPARPRTLLLRPRPDRVSTAIRPNANYSHRIHPFQRGSKTLSSSVVATTSIYTNMARIFHPWILLLARSTQREMAQMIDYLKTENRILRSKLPKRLKVTPAEGEQLIKREDRWGRRSES